ncbi:hypothetical protein [Variovorax paradoxus]|uniref:hypothetical protein n=1 Tax=Variovorax paradoxus TaxID=34073 RepID=UPI001933E918|nr:hypothetical protein INQ48_43070 [Variovorax paradoxus]
MNLTHTEEHACFDLRYFVDGTTGRLGPAKGGRVEILRKEVCECCLDTIDRLRAMCWEWIREQDARDFQKVDFQATEF